MKREKNKVRNAEKGKSKAIKALALSQVCMMVLEIFAFCFIFSMSFGEVSADLQQITLNDGKLFVYDNSNLDEGYEIRANTNAVSDTIQFAPSETPKIAIDQYNSKLVGQKIQEETNKISSTIISNARGTLSAATESVQTYSNYFVDQGKLVLETTSDSIENIRRPYLDPAETANGIVDTTRVLKANTAMSEGSKVVVGAGGLVVDTFQGNTPVTGEGGHYLPKGSTYIVPEGYTSVARADATITSSENLDTYTSDVYTSTLPGNSVSSYVRLDNGMKISIGGDTDVEILAGTTVTQMTDGSFRIPAGAKVTSSYGTVTSTDTITATSSEWDSGITQSNSHGIEPKTGAILGVNGNYDYKKGTLFKVGDKYYEATSDGTIQDGKTTEAVSDTSKFKDTGAKSKTITPPGLSTGGRTTPYQIFGNLHINAPSTALDANGAITAGAIGLSTAGNLLQGLTWATAAWGVVEGLEKMGIVPEEMSKPLGQALFAGVMLGKTVNIGADLGYYSSGWAVGAGLLAGYLIFANGYKETKTKTATVSFKCMTWQAPIIQGRSERTKECNKCNTDPLRPCSEYRCKALGQSCKIINAGTAQVKCIDSAPDDVTSPGIKPWKEVLTKGYEYTAIKPRPAGKGTGSVSGMSVTKNNGCLEAWNPFIFGIITTDKDNLEQPAQCKIDFNHTTSFDDMAYWMGEVNTFMENHSQSLALPGTKDLETTFPELQNDGNYKLYLRCRDGNGNTNEDEFVVSFCIDKTPDLTPPIIKTTSPTSGSPVLYKVDNLSVNVYTNEPAKCKWTRTSASTDYGAMENNMSCANNVWQINAESLYTCTTTLTGIKDKAENKFYFRCEDLSEQKNTMTESYEYTLFGTQPLTILQTGPSGTIGSATSTANISLTVKTDNGYNNGESICSYSTSNTGTYQEMFETGGTNTHSQTLDLVGGTYTYYFKCLDLGGNTAYNSTSFTVYIDKYAPQVLRFYNTEGKIRILTNENAICKYSTDSCNFDLNKEGITSMLYDGTKEHWVEWKTDQTYYVKCMDEFNNQPDSADCSVIIRPYELSKK